MATSGSQSERVSDDELVVIPADRTETERREAYEVEWREPVDTPGVLDRFRRLF